MDQPLPWIENSQGWALLVILACAGAALITWALIAKRRAVSARRCPKCGFDMRSAATLRCNECGHCARSEWSLRRLRPWQRWGAVASGVLLAGAYPAYRTICWSHDRDWTPPLSEWKAIDARRLPHGARVEILERRHRRAFGRICRITARDGTITEIEGHTFEIVGGSSLRDMTGDGAPDLVIMAFSGGAHCCSTFHLFELPSDGSVRAITTIDARDGGQFVDLDGDGIDEFETYDWSLAYALTCFACLDYPRIVLRFEEDDYRVDIDLMRRPAPSEAALTTLARKTREVAERSISPDAPGQSDQGYPLGHARDQLWSTMLELIYTGHEDRAYRLFDEAWPDDFPIRLELPAFREAVEGSPFRSAVKVMQRGPQ